MLTHDAHFSVKIDYVIKIDENQASILITIYFDAKNERHIKKSTLFNHLINFNNHITSCFSKCRLSFIQYFIGDIIFLPIIF